MELRDGAPTREQMASRWEALKKERQTWFVHWQEITNYLLPRNGRYFLTDRNKGWRRHNAIFDSTGGRANDALAAGLMAGMTSPARPWFKLVTPDPSLMRSQAVRVWLDETTRMILRVFNRGNTYRALASIYKELGAFGTAANVMLDDQDDVVRHYTLTAGEYCIAQNWKGQVCTLYREFQKTVGELVKEFGVENVSNTVKSLYDRNQLDQWVTVVHAIEPREDRDPTKRDSKNMAWSSVYFEAGTAPDGRVLRESGYNDFPALVPRWDLAGGDIYGNGPGMAALGDIKQLQQQQLRKGQAIDYMTKPPLQMPASMKNREIDALPGGISYIDNTQVSGTRNLFEVRLNLDHMLQDIQDVRMRIDQCFFKDLFLMIASSANSRMTATEVAERQEEKLLMLGPVLERASDELLSPLIDRTFARLIETNSLPPPPPELHGHELKIEFTSMLAQAQRAITSNSVDRYVASLSAVAQFKPDVLDKFDSDAWADAYADMLGVDPSLVIGNDKVALVREQRARAQAAAQQAQLMQQRADTAASLAKVPTEGGSSNLAADAVKQFSGYGGSPLGALM